MSDTPKKQRFVVKTHFDPKIGIHHKDIFIDDKLFPYEIDQASLMEAKKMGPAVFMQVQMDIQTHLLKSLSDFTGREITAQSLMAATRTGWI